MVKLVIILVLVKTVISQRRITNGSTVDDTITSNFMVYLINGNLTESYGDWICSGAIIHPFLVLTSAACLLDVDLAYVISGYDKYVPNTELETDQCTKRFKKKVISFCVPHSFTLDKGISWASYDIGIAKVDSQFDFYNLDYEKYCTYAPKKINVQFNEIYEAEGTDVVTFGWGHSTFFAPDDNGRDINLNEKKLQYASSVIMNKVLCQGEHSHPYKKEYIASTMICTSGGKGRIDANGVYQDFEEPKHTSCRRRSAADSNSTENCQHENIAANSEVNLNKTYNTTRRHGPCQNDHGSPLIGWIGGRRYVLGVATVANVMTSMECTGPYLWTSVTATSKFVNCVLESQKTSYVDQNNRRMCEEEQIITKNLTWPQSEESFED